MSPALIVTLAFSFLSRSDLQEELLYAAKLRERGLLRLAEVHCKQLLAGSELEEADRGSLTIELAKTLSARALNSRPPDREQYWREAHARLDKALSEAEQPTKILLRTQKSLTLLLQAEWSRREGEIRATTDADWESARAQLRTAIQELKGVEQELQSPEIRSGAGDELNGTHMHKLLRNVQLQLAIAYWNQAVTYANNPTDRVNSLTLAIDKLEPLATSTLQDSLVWEARVERIRCLRLLRDFQQAGKLLAEATTAPKENMPLVAAEGIRLALAMKNPMAARQLAGHASKQRHPEFELARIETLVALASDAAERKDEAESQELQREATQLASTIAADFGVYWGLRAEMLISRLADAPGTAKSTDLLETAAKSFLQRNLPADAVQMFAKAAVKAEDEGDLAGALNYQKQAAAVEHQQGKLQPAIDHLRAAALKYSAQSSASEVHLAAVFHAAELYQQRVQSSASATDTLLAQYESLLKEHIASWPGHRSANQARLWLGRLMEATHEFNEAVLNYRSISPTAAESLERFQRLTALSLRLPTMSEEQITEARNWFDNQSRLVSNGSAESTGALLAVAELSLLRTPADYLMADAALRRALASLPENAPELTRIHGLLVVVAAGREQMPVAVRELAKALPLPARPLSQLLRGLQIVHDSQPYDPDLLAMMGQVAKLLTTYRERLSASDLLLLRETEADTVRVSDPAQATRIYAELATDHPSNGRIQEAYAEVLSLGGDRGSRLNALNQWRIVVRGSEPRSTAWFRGKLGLATTHVNLGQRQQAREIIDLLLTLHPELGGPDLKSQFLQLRERADD